MIDESIRDRGRAVDELMNELELTFDLSSSVGRGTLGSRIEGRLLELQGRPMPDWGTAGPSDELFRAEEGPLRFYYRPHLFPDMAPALRLAHQLQFDLLPKELPPDSPLGIAAFLESYCHLSGDLLGWRLEEDELVLWIADVAGHGVGAGLAAATLYCFVDGMEPGLSPAALARGLHERVLGAQRSSDRRKLFATAIFLRVRADGRVRFSSSGHGPFLLRRPGGEVEELEATGPALGIWTDPTFDEEEVLMEKDALLLLCTDGLVELRDSDEEPFGTAPLSRLMRDSSTPVELCQRIYRAIVSHRPLSSLQDDVTFLSAALR